MKSSVSHAKRLISRWFSIPEEIILPRSLPSLGGMGEKGRGDKVVLSPPPPVKREDHPFGKIGSR
jgi:hypothetical protein